MTLRSARPTEKKSDAGVLTDAKKLVNVRHPAEGAMMKRTHSSRYDSADYLKSEEAIRAYLEECFAENDPALITHALGVAARARGMMQLSRETGLTREGLYKALDENGNPSFATILKVTNALGFKLRLTPNQGASDLFD